jgi:hypothetical protein
VTGLIVAAGLVAATVISYSLAAWYDRRHKSSSEEGEASS